MNHHPQQIIIVLMALNLSACGSLIQPRSQPTPRPTRTPIHTPEALPTYTPAPNQPTSTPLPDWETLAPGLEFREMIMDVPSARQPVIMSIVRIDPQHYDFRVHYDLDRPVTVAEWQAQTGATALIDGAFFEPRQTVLGLLVEDGEYYGNSFTDHGGMLTVQGDVVNVRSLEQFPYLPTEEFDYAIQGRPQLLQSGGRPAEFDLSAEASRRTVIAQDQEGRILFIVNDYGAVTLYRLRDWLEDTRELDISVAFNLDGGGSTGMAITAGGHNLLIDSWWGVASVVAIYPKP